MKLHVHDLREMTENELKEKLDQLQDLLFKRRFESHDEQAKNPGEIKMAKKNIARIKTILAEKTRKKAAEEAKIPVSAAGENSKKE
jgi:large subunit ribosomal protein L29